MNTSCFNCLAEECFIETLGYTVCTKCGTEQGYFNFFPEVNAYERCHPFSKESNDPILNDLQKIMQFTDEEKENIYQLWKEFSNVCEIRCAKRKILILTACLYHITRQRRNDCLTLDSIKAKLMQYKVDVSDLKWAINKLYKELNIQQQQAVTNQSLLNSLNRFELKCLALKKDDFVAIKKTVFKLYDKTYNSPKLQTLDDNNINACYIFMSCKYLKLKITMKEVANKCFTTPLTLLRIEKILQDIICCGDGHNIQKSLSDTSVHD